MNLADLNDAIRQIRESQPTLIVSHEDYDQIASAGLPANIQSSTLLESGQAFVIRAGMLEEPLPVVVAADPLMISTYP